MTVMDLPRIDEDLMFVNTDNNDDEPDCIVCPCSPRLSLCGRLLHDEMGDTYNPEIDDNMCDDCVELEPMPCPRCGDW